jgi:hypothetical protein
MVHGKMKIPPSYSLAVLVNWGQKAILMHTASPLTEIDIERKLKFNN